jgi:hypothetical protein
VVGLGAGRRGCARSAVGGREARLAPQGHIQSGRCALSPPGLALSRPSHIPCLPPADDGIAAATGGSSTGSLLAGVKAAVAVAAAAAPSRLSVPGPGLAGRASMGFGAADVAKLRDQLTDLTM